MAVDICAANVDYKSLQWCPGKTRLPGIRKRVYYIRKAAIVKFPTPGKGKYDGDFELAEGEFFKFIDVVIKKSKFKGTSQGESPCKTFKQHLEAFYPGLEEDIIDFETNANNDDLIYIVQQSVGKFKVLGCQEYPTDTTFDSDSGSEVTESMGVSITADCDAPTDLLVYTGKILTAAEEDANDQGV